MDQETPTPATRPDAPEHDAPALRPAQAPLVAAPPIQDAGCSTCAFVYALGQIEARFPRLSVEKEFSQVAGLSDTAGKTDQQVFQAVLTKPENRYLLRQLCWVFTIQGLETYLLQPRNPADFDLLAESIRAEPRPDDIDVVVGVRGPIAPAEMCNGLMIPIVVFDHIYSFDRTSLLKAIPRPDKEKKPTARQFDAAATEVLDRILQMTDNAGASDDHRAVNYLTIRYAAIYTKAAEAFGDDASLSAVEVRASPLSGTRRIVDVIFAYTHRKTDFTEKFSARVDVTEEFPFLVGKLAPYYDR